MILLHAIIKDRGGCLILAGSTEQAVLEKLLPALSTFWCLKKICPKSCCTQLLWPKFLLPSNQYARGLSPVPAEKVLNIWCAPYTRVQGGALSEIYRRSRQTLQAAERQIWWSRSAISIIQQLVKSLQGPPSSFIFCAPNARVVFERAPFEMHLVFLFCAARCSSGLNEGKLISQSLEKEAKMQIEMPRSSSSSSYIALDGRDSCFALLLAVAGFAINPLLVSPLFHSRRVRLFVCRLVLGAPGGRNSRNIYYRRAFFHFFLRMRVVCGWRDIRWNQISQRTRV